MKRPVKQDAKSACDAAIQLRALAGGRLHTILTEHYTKARGVFLGMNELERQRLIAGFVTRLEGIEPGAARSRFLVHLGQIHGDLADAVARSFAERTGKKAYA